MPARKEIQISDLLKDKNHVSYIEMVGKKYNRLTIVGYAGYRILPSGLKYHYLSCKCECGNDVLGVALHIKAGKWSSCGCLRSERTVERLTKHGYSPLKGKREKIYVTWQSIKKRCYNKNNSHYYLYGQIGICVCNGWKNNFLNFKNDMSPITGKSIDRIDSNGNYSCGHCEECIEKGWIANCRWADDYMQSNNRSYNKHIVVNGVKMTWRQADRALGFPLKTIQGRKYRGWTDEETIAIIPKVGNRKPILNKLGL